MKISAPDHKTQIILDAAWASFSAYGFRKASMDDIARGAGMSRPALYLHFKNKEAIFCALVEIYYDTARNDIAAALAQGATLLEKLDRAFAVHGGETMEAMMSSAHGMELLEASMSVAGDMIKRGEAQLQALYAAWLVGEAGQGRVVLTCDADTLGGLFCACLKGVKHTSATYAEYQAGVAAYAALCARGLDAASAA